MTGSAKPQEVAGFASERLSPYQKECIMGLFSPIWMANRIDKLDKAVAAVNQISDQRKLKRIALEAPLPSVADAAVKKLIDENDVKEVALSNSSAKVDALKRITDQQFLYDIAKPDSGKNESLRAHAIENITDSQLLRSLIIAYQGEKGLQGKRDRYLESTLQAASRRYVASTGRSTSLTAKEAIALEDLETMSYPADRDRIIKIAQERGGDAGNLAVSMLPYEHERETLRDLARNGKGLARSAALSKLCCPEDRDAIDAIIADSKAGKILTQRAARLLPDGDPDLQKLCCSYCGAPAAIRRNSGYSQSSDMFYTSLECTACGHRELVYEGYGEPKSFVVTLAELRDMD